jgi:hypothetical protein
MKFAIQDRIFMARLCELGERPEDMLDFLFQAIEKKENHFIAVPEK